MQVISYGLHQATSLLSIEKTINLRFLPRPRETTGLREDQVYNLTLRSKTVTPNEPSRPANMF